MERFKQWLSKIPVKVFLIVYIVLSFVLPILIIPLNIEKKSLAALAVIILSTFCLVLLAIRFMIYLKAKESNGYRVIKSFIYYVLIFFPAILFIIVDIDQDLKGFLMIPGLTLEAGLLIWLLVRHLIKQWKKERHVSEETGISYSFEKFCGDLLAGREIEFIYDNVRYLFIPENGRYYFKRIVAIDPYEYEILAEAENALACVDASSVNGKKIAGLWPDAEDITVY